MSMKSGTPIFVVKRLDSNIKIPFKVKVINQSDNSQNEIIQSPNLFLKKKRNSTNFPANSKLTNGRWNEEEHKIFLDNSIILGNDWKKVKR